MRRDSGTTDSIWPTTRGLDADGPLEGRVDADVCVVGAGVVGLSVAYQLMRDGKSVVVLDDGPVAGGETGRTTAHLVTAVDDRYVELERLHGPKGAKLAAASHQAAIEWTEDVVRSERLKCHWMRVDGFLFDPPGASTDLLERELAAAHRAGVEGVEWADCAPIPGLDTGRALAFHDQAELDPSAYLKGLVRVLRNGGVRIHTPTHAARLKRPAGGLEVIATDGSRVACSHVVEATNAPVFGHDGVFLKQAAYRTYVVAFPIAPGTVERALYWDTADPYHYARVRDSRGGQQHLIVGGGDHRTGEDANPQAIWQAMADWTRARWPTVGPGLPSHAWSGQVWEPVDGLAFIGKAVRSDVLLATGDSGNGWTHAPIAAMLLADEVSGRPNPWATLYDPHRKTLGSASEWLKETGKMVGAAGRIFQPGQVADASHIAAGEGALVRHGLSMRACFRDEDGNLHERSAVCKHLGCLVNWNSGEKTWDCPCHGSRYDRFGTVVSGPANENLDPVGEPDATPDGIRAPRTTTYPERPQPVPRVGRKRRAPGAPPHGKA